MTALGDDVNEMPPHTLDDETVEAVLRGEFAQPELRPLVEVVGALRATAALPARPSAELVTRIAAGDFAGVPAAAFDPRGGVAETPRGKVGQVVHAGRSKLAAMSTRAKVAVGLAAGITALTGVSAAGALPDAAQDRVESVIEVVTPITFDDEPAEFGQDVSDDARDGGVDGQDVSERARDAHHPDEPGDQGRDQPGDQGRRDERKSDDAPDHRPTDQPAADPTRPDPTRKPDVPGGRDGDTSQLTERPTEPPTTTEYEPPVRMP